MRDDELSARLSKCAVAGPSGSLPSGRVVGDWRITAFVARGGNAEVYCAEHVLLGTPAAVKVLRDCGRPERRDRFRREAKILSQLKSAHFPGFHAFGSSDGRDYLVEELLEPRDLPTSPREASRLLLELCEAVGELHSQGWVHCDIKPANILFRPGSDVPVLIDLGLAVSRTEDSGGGSRGYSAPEQFLGGEITPAADIHALGVLAERMRLDCRGIIRRATSSIPTERFATVAEFASALRRRALVRRLTRMAVAIFVAGGFAASLSHWWSSRLPIEMHLNGQTVLCSEPIRIASGREMRVIGPGTLDAEISGGRGSRLWMTNCVVLNRSRSIFPAVPLFYELAGDVYLNFINHDEPPKPDWRTEDYFARYDDDGNEVRYRGPDTITGLIQLHNQEGPNRNLR